MQLSFHWTRIDRCDLDGLLAEIADRCGLEAVQFLVERFGGDTLYVPTRPARHGLDEVRRKDLQGWLREVAERHSLALVRVLIELRGGEPIYIPVASKLEEAVVERQIRRLYDGTNAGDLAARFGLSRRKVRELALRKAPGKASESL